jgi:glycosyltransferase involved in cell wall biosynthesis
VKLLLITAFPYQGRNVGGVSTVAEYLVDHLIHTTEIEKIVVISLRPEFKNIEIIKTVNANFTIFFVPAQKHLSRLLWRWPDFFKLQKLMKSFHYYPDIIHGQGVAGDGLLAINLGQRNNIPVIVTVHGMVDIEEKMKSGRMQSYIVSAMMDSIMRRAHGVIFTSHYRIDELKCKCKGSTYLIENSVSDGFFQIHTHAARTNEKMIISVGRIDRRKGVTDLLYAFKIVSDTLPDVKLCIIGPAVNREYLQEIQSLIRSLKFTNNVILAGEVDENELIAYYNSARLFVMSSLEETAPQALAQALVAGLPAVSTNVGGIPFMIKDNHNGYLVNVGDIKMLAERIILLLNNDELWNSFSKSARKEGDRFRGSIIAQQTLSAYKEVIANYCISHK